MSSQRAKKSITTTAKNEPRLQVRLKRLTDGSAALSCARADGSLIWQRQSGSRGVVFPAHDLTHFAVESTLGYAQGFFGLLLRAGSLATSRRRGRVARSPRKRAKSRRWWACSRSSDGWARLDRGAAERAGESLRGGAKAEPSGHGAGAHRKGGKPRPRRTSRPARMLVRDSAGRDPQARVRCRSRVAMVRRPVNSLRRVAFVLLAAALLFSLEARAQKFNGRELVQASLIADTSAVVPGKRSLSACS